MKIAIIGSGFVGSNTGRFLQRHHSIIFFDVSEKRVAELELKGLDATSDLKRAVNESEAAFLCVPTPTAEDGKIDLSYIKRASSALAGELKSKKETYAVVVKSTVVPGTTKNIVKPALEKSGKTVGKDILLCANPEFMTQIASSWSSDKSMDKSIEDRFIIGELNKESGDVLEKLYAPFGMPIFRLSLEEAEFAKYANNYILPARISVYNELLLAAEKLREKGVDVDTHKIAKILTMDKRIGIYGSIHGKAFGGLCFPKDTKAFYAFLKEQGYDAKILKSVIDVNDEIKSKCGVRE